MARDGQAYPIKSDNVIAHIRKATQGRVALENCHPFVRELWGRYWVFAHNGDLKDFAPRLHGAFRPVGDTDSERAFCWLMQEMNKAHASVPSVAELSATLAELVPQVAAHGTFNFMLEQRRRAVGALLDAAALRGAPAPVRHARAAGRGPERRLRAAHLAERPRRGRRHRAADDRRALDRLRAGRDEGLRRRRAVRC